ncbi:MAG: hypothetical protein HY658_10245 [Actinobacteria bacterium]|nr:hypothetical protein [Actinomycetota bacterium]
MRFRGHPWMGAISGLFFGLAVAVLIQQFGIWPLDNLSVFGLPAIGLVIGLLVAAWGPIGRGRADPFAERPVDRPAATAPPAGPTQPTPPQPPAGGETQDRPPGTA